MICFGVFGMVFGAIANAEDVSAKKPAVAQNTMSKREVDVDKVVFKPGKGLEIVSKDGDFKMITRLRAQMRYTLQDAEEMSHGFQLRRARLLFQGNVFGKNNGYKFELAVSPRDIGLKSSGTISKSPLLDWYFHFSHHRDLTVRIGQYKVPYSRQRVVSSGNLQFVDRSIANGEFTVDRDVGLDLRSKNLFGLNRFRYYAGIYMGEGHSSYAEGDFGMMYLGRVEFLPFGLFKDYSEVSFRRPARPQLSIGAAFGYVGKAKRNKGIIGSVPADGGTTDTRNVTADLCLRYSGLSVESAFFWRDGVRAAGDAVDESGVPIPLEAARNGMGYYVQGGYLLPKSNNELTLRYGEIIPAGSETSLTEESEAGIGVNHYFGAHAYKIQTDIFQIWSEDGFAEGDTQFRLQMQMAY